MAQGARTVDGEGLRRLASGNLPVPSCPGCGHLWSVRPIAEVAVQRVPRAHYGKSGLDLYLQRRISPALTPLPPPPPRGLRAPRPPRDLRQERDHRLTIIVNLGFLALSLWLAGRASRALELVDLAGLLGLAAVCCVGWLLFGVWTGRLARAVALAELGYRRALSRWAALYCCEDCGGVFAPGWHGCLLPEQVPAYLRGEAERMP